METAIELIRTLFWCATFLVVVFGVLFAVYMLGLAHGEDEERTRKHNRDEAVDRAMEKVQKLAKKDPDLWESEIDA